MPDIDKDETLSEHEESLNDVDTITDVNPPTEIDNNTEESEPHPPDDNTTKEPPITDGDENVDTSTEEPPVTDGGEDDNTGPDQGEDTDDSSSGGVEDPENPTDPDDTKEPDSSGEDNKDPEQPEQSTDPETPPEDDDKIVVLPPVDISGVSQELRDLPVAESINPEDYVIINKDKGILQVRFGDLLRATMQALEYENIQFPDANKLTELIDRIIRKQDSIKAVDVIWDGDSHKEYGSVRGAIMYVMDTIDRLGGNISGDNITINPDADTPQNVIEDLNGRNKLSDILNYIYANYRREDTMVPGSMVKINTSGWKNTDLKVPSKNLSADEALNKLYTYVTTGIDKSVKAYFQNLTMIDVPMNDDEFEIGHYFVNVPEPTRLDLTASLEIFCRVPGTIIIDVYYDDTKVFSLKDAFTTGYHTTNYIKTMLIDTVDPENIGHKITFNAKYYTDTIVSDVLIPASIDEAGFLSILEGQRISIREGEE